MPSTRSSRAAIKDTDAVKPTDLEGRANANTVTAVEKKGNHRSSQRSKASSLVKKEVPPAADILSNKGRGKHQLMMRHQS